MHFEDKREPDAAALPTVVDRLKEQVERLEEQLEHLALERHELLQALVPFANSVELVDASTIYKRFTVTPLSNQFPYVKAWRLVQQYDPEGEVRG